MADTKALPSETPVWDTFPQDLISVPCISKEYAYLNDEKVLREMGQEIRAKLLKDVESSGKFDMKSGAILLMGGTSAQANYYDTDTTSCPFRQESFFQYLFRLAEPDAYGVIFLGTKKSVLFVPVLDEATYRWNGPPRSLKYYKEKYGMDEAILVSSLGSELAKRGVTTVYTLMGTNTDSGLSTALVPSLPKLMKGVSSEEAKRVVQDDKILYPVLAECRVRKTPLEIEFMRVCCRVSSQAHVFVMRHIKPGMSEMQLESMFKAFCGMYGGARHVAYTCICASGPHGSILHYGHAGRPNDRIIGENDMLVLDMGGEFQGYATDITCSYPVSGKFSEDQTSVHNAVREAQQAVFDSLRPGVSWLEMHQLAERVILKHLLRMGLLKGATVDELMEVNMGSVFMPHGLGHFIGMDVHDVGGYIYGLEKKDNTPGVCWLRTQRKLDVGMVLTVEPGLYFSPQWLDAALKDEKKNQYVDHSVLKRFRGMGGVRLEDDVVITETGYENMNQLPKTIAEYESVVQKYAPKCSPCEE